MKRHPSLQDLSRDHHVVLIRAKQLRTGSQDGGSAPHDAAQRFLRFWERDLAAHFTEEEEVLLHALRDHVPPDDLRVRTVRDDHRWIRGRVPELAHLLDRDEDPRPLVAALGNRLAAHVRFEENELFEAAQRLLPAAELDRLGDASRAWRAKHRRSDACQLP